MALSGAIFSQQPAGEQPADALQSVCQPKVFSVVASPAEETRNSMNLSWATAKEIKEAVLEYAPVNAKHAGAKHSDAKYARDAVRNSRWAKSISKICTGTFCTTYDSVYSKTAKGEDFYEDVKINKFNECVSGLKKNTLYKYRVIADGDTSTTHYFKTGGSKEWSACIISDFHVYSPLYGRTKAAMEMIGTVERAQPNFDFILHLGDITAWGGSYSFWQNMYNEKPFEDYMWAGVNGNHDNMTRGYHRTTNEFFRDAAAYPHNGYGNEMGVCYFFKHGDVLFIMLNNESMKTEQGLKEAQEWVRKVVKENPSVYKIVCEHYQWFYGENGKTSQYERWNELFDELGIDLALGANNHIYASTHPIFNGNPQATGTVYIQTTSSDNERGVECDLSKPLEFNADKIKFRWTEGPQTVSGMYMKVSRKKLTLVLLNRHGEVLDTTEVFAKKKTR